MQTVSENKLLEIAVRIKEMREIIGYSVEEMAQKTEVTQEQYLIFEQGKEDLPFSFIHKCALAFDVEITDLLKGHSAHLSSYTVTRKGKGQQTVDEDGIQIQNLAPRFRSKIAEPYWVKYEYSADQQNRPIHTTTHSGQEFDLVISGSLKVQVGNNTEILHEGDSIYYDSGTPHGMIAVDGQDCLFLAVVLPGEDAEEKQVRESIVTARTMENLVSDKYAAVFGRF